MTESEEKFVLDTSAILNGVADLISPNNFVPPEVLEEIKLGSLSRVIELSRDLINVLTPSAESIEEVCYTARKSGDFTKMSNTDIMVVSLALELKATVLSNDYCIQNVCSLLHIPFRGISMKKIQRTVLWKYSCTGCGKHFDEPLEICPVCGHNIRRVAKAIKGN
ncbi:MAG: hypothetical protein M1431_05060 [Candidatus Thermoplasmatota archaeon]|nr:hypothetical protein [Candidatus Thermoplasmatota archaeon]